MLIFLSGALSSETVPMGVLRYSPSIYLSALSLYMK